MPTRSQVGVLLLSIFVVAACGLTYELLMGAVASYLLGSSVTWFSLVIGAFLTAMGVGAWLSRGVHARLLEIFVGVEIAIGIVGGLAGVALFAAFTFTRFAEVVLFALVLVIGALVGLEIPILTRWLEPHGSLREAIANVLGFDYLGALVASILFPLVLLPSLGLLKTFFAVGLANLLVAGITLVVFRETLRGRAVLGGAALGGAAVLVGGLVGAERLVSGFEARMYRDEIVWAEQSPFQRIVLTKWGDDLRLYLDGHLQASSRDEYRYHESLVHLPMGLAASRERVLVLGGGDGLAVREVLRWPDVKEVVLVDLDPQITDLAAEHPLLVDLNEGSLADPRVTVVNDDAWKFLERDADRWPVIVVDFPDPHDERLAKLYSVTFYELLARHLSPGGVASVQATSPYFARDAYWCVAATAEEAGLQTRSYHVWVPSFGEWGFHLLSEHAVDPEAARLPEGLRYLEPAVIDAMFTFPPDLARTDVEPSRLDHPVIVRYYTEAWKRWF